MKKILVVLIVALVVLSSASAFRVKSVGIETGSGLFASVDMEIVENLDVYARAGLNYYFYTGGGVQYKVASFDLDKTTVDVKPGVQTTIGFGEIYGLDCFDMLLLGTCQFAFETDRLTGFLRPCLGLSLSTVGSGESKTKSHDFAWTIEAGVAYLF